MPARGTRIAEYHARAGGAVGDVRGWTWLAVRPWCKSDLDACQRLGVPEGALYSWRESPYFRQLETQVSAHMADVLWLPRQRMRAMMASGVDELEQLLHYGDNPPSIGQAKIRLEALRILFSSNGFAAHVVGDDPRFNGAAGQQGINLSMLSDAELESLGQLATTAAQRALQQARKAEPAAAPIIEGEPAGEK